MLRLAGDASQFAAGLGNVMARHFEIDDDRHTPDNGPWIQLVDRIKQHVRANTTPRHVPAKIVQVTDIPRTKSNKIVELAVRNVVHGLPVRNIEALANPEALEQYRDREELKT